MAVIVLQGLFLLLLLCFYMGERETVVLDDAQMTSEGIFMDDFLGSGVGGYYMDSSFEATQDFARTKGMELKPGIYEITMYYRGEGGPQAYLLDADNADFKLWQGNYHSELPADRTSYTTLVWNAKTLHNFVVSCDYGGDGYILFSGVRIAEKRGWAAALGLLCLFLFGFGDFLFFRYGERVRGFFSEKNRVILGGCLFVTLFSSLPLFCGLLFYGHDLEFHLLRIEGLKDGLLARQFPVKMQPNWMNGYGYGVSAFYGDFLLYVPACLRLAGVGVQGAYQCYVLMVNALTCLISFFSFRAFTGNDRMGLAGSFLFTSSVYRLNCIYVRAAVGEYTAMAFMPLYFYGIYAMLFLENPAQTGKPGQTEKKGKYGWLCASAGFAGIFHSHMISSEIVAVITVLAGAVYVRRLLHKGIWVEIGKCAAAVLGCTAGFLVPFADLARDSYIFNAKGGEPSYMQTYGTMLSQVLNPFPAGGGESLAYSMVERAGLDEQFSHAVGFGFVVAVVCYVYCFVLLDRDKKCAAVRRCRHFLWWGCFLVYATTVWFPWNRMQENIGALEFLIANIQFPWRLLGAASVLLVFFCCALFAALRECGRKQAFYVCGTVLLAAALSGAYFLSDRINDNNTVYLQNADDLDSFHVMGGEYMPVAAVGKKDMTWGDAIISGSGMFVEHVEREYNRFRITCSTLGQDAAYMELPLLYYRGYAAECDGGGIGECTVMPGDGGRVRVTVPDGYAGTVEVSYREPWHWRLAELVNVCSVAVLSVKAGSGFRKKRGAYRESGV